MIVGEIVKVPAKSAAATMIVPMRDTLMSVVPSGGIDPDLWYSSLVIEANGLGFDKSGAKYEVTPVSLATAALNAAYLGLQFGKSLGHAYLVPFGNKAASQNGRVVKDITLVTGWKGYRHLAYQTGFLKTFHVDTAWRGETFEYWKDESGPRLKHVPGFDRDPSAARANITHAYVIYETTNGGRGIRVVGRKEIDKADSRRDVWNSHYESMVRKTAIIRAAAEWNLTSKMAHAIELDREADNGNQQTLPPELAGIAVDAVPKLEPAWSMPPDATDLNAANETYSSLHQRIMAGPSRTDGAQILADITAAKNDGAITAAEEAELTQQLNREME